ncbi:hypothetical protein AALP_AA2G163700 [Arabis alpina]|uniref:TIR domain-containing protein n=1 Tax=Arabis alpina TaxID=50452 RepID=A0A087HHW0_ARAAL|nr:hypothetical protein AALP_AA2G163700 [Arabis alpina]
MELPRVIRQYDVFLSFRGEDTRKGIVSHLHRAFRSRGIDKIFKDDNTLEIGDSISEEIKEAIHNSKFAVLVISKNYASSTWCLDELQMIMELHKKKQLIAVPIFYNVDPSDVRHQKGTFDLKSKDEATMVADIVAQISKQLSSMEPLDFSDIVGMKVRMEQLNTLLSVESEDEVRMIGIWGMGGIGKTTIAKCLYEEYSRRFARYCFIENVRISAKNGLPYLQKKLLSNIRGKKQDTLWCVEKGCSCIKSKIKDKIFLVLDDVDNMDQLHALAKKTGWFGPGSRIIITTRDFGLLYSFGVRLLYHVSLLDNNDAIQVFNQVAFEGGQPPSDIYQRFSIRASRLAQGLPLALEAFGTYLRRITWIEGWEKALRILETVPHQSIMDILKTSFDGLDEQEQSAFLHVACLFNGDSVHRVNALIDDGDIRTKALEAKSLIDISPDGCITMHVLIEQAAREIVRQESGSMPWRQRILWKTDPIIFVLQKNTVSISTLLDSTFFLILISMVLAILCIVFMSTDSDSLIRVLQRLKV